MHLRSTRFDFIGFCVLGVFINRKNSKLDWFEWGAEIRIWFHYRWAIILPIVYNDTHLQIYFGLVGGGTAGCVLASRLSQDASVSVLLIEAGSTFSPLSLVPFLTSQQQKTHNDWKFSTVSQKHSSFGFVDQVNSAFIQCQCENVQNCIQKYQ